MQNIKAICLFVFLIFIFRTENLFSQQDTTCSTSSGYEIYLGYSYDNLNKSAKFLNLGTTFIENKSNFLTPIFNFDALIGFSDAKNIYSINFTPGMRCQTGRNSDFKFYYEALAGVSFIKHPLNQEPEIGFNSKLGLDFGYKNYLIYFDFRYIQSKNFIINPITIGFKYRIPLE